MPRVLLTGSTGFIGSACLARLLTEPDYSVVVALRKPEQEPVAGVTAVTVGNLAGDTDWRNALEGVDMVIHAAARAHVTEDSPDAEVALYREINSTASLNLARQAAMAGVQRLVFLSSIHVVGTESVTPLSEADPPRPESAYAQSKFEAETGLLEIARNTELEIVIIRPPLVYGPGVSANFARLVGAVKRQIPLPLALVNNRRSLVGIDNLVDFIFLCLSHPAAANRVFHVADGVDLSTAQLVRLIAAGLGVRAWLLPVPRALLAIAASLAGQRHRFNSVCGDLQVDIGRARELLNWHPPTAVETGITRAVECLRDAD